jgi:hypothetical protein
MAEAAFFYRGAFSTLKESFDQIIHGLSVLCALPSRMKISGLDFCSDQVVANKGTYNGPTSPERISR